MRYMIVHIRKSLGPETDPRIDKVYFSEDSRISSAEFLIDFFVFRIISTLLVIIVIFQNSNVNFPLATDITEYVRHSILEVTTIIISNPNNLINPWNPNRKN